MKTFKELNNKIIKNKWLRIYFKTSKILFLKK